MVKGTLAEVRNLGFQVNRHNPNELVDHCILKFKTENEEELYTYPLTKGCHASGNLGKIIRTLLGRDMNKDDFIDNKFDSDVLIGKEALLELNEINTIIEVYEADYQPLFNVDDE